MSARSDRQAALPNGPAPESFTLLGGVGAPGGREAVQRTWTAVEPEPAGLLQGSALAGGASRLVDLLLDAGYARPAVLDISSVALEKARARLGNRASLVTWLVDDVTSWNPGGPFDIWHDRAVFHFLVSRERRQGYVAAMARALLRGGQVILGTFASDGPERCSGLPVARYEPETLAAELGPRFHLVESLHEEHLTPAGKVQRFQFSRLVRV